MESAGVNFAPGKEIENGNNLNFKLVLYDYGNKAIN